VQTVPDADDALPDDIGRLQALWLIEEQVSIGRVSVSGRTSRGLLVPLTTT